MTVVKSKRNASKFEVVVQAEIVANNIVHFSWRRFGIKTPVKDGRRAFEECIRQNCRTGAPGEAERAEKALEMMVQKTVKAAENMQNMVTAANTLYPISLHECDIRRDYQNRAIAECQIIKNTMQRISKMYVVNMNQFTRYTNIVDREMKLIKGWRKADTRHLRSKYEGKSQGQPL